MTKLPGRFRDSIAAGTVLAASLAAAVFVPHRLLGPASLGSLGMTAAGLLGIRAYRRRLLEAIRFLSASRAPGRSDQIAALLGERERWWLGVKPEESAATTISRLKRRNEQLLSFGMAVGCAAIAAGVAAIIVYVD